MKPSDDDELMVALMTGFITVIVCGILFLIFSRHVW